MQNAGILHLEVPEFESFDNSERCKTQNANFTKDEEFESFVNSERYKT